MIVTDYLPANIKAFKKEFYTLKKQRVEHIGMPIFIDGTSNKAIEGMQGTIRERDKVLKGMKKEGTAKVSVDGLKAYYNYLRPHMGLEDETPVKKVKNGSRVLNE